MHIGVCMFATEYAIRIDELAREAEARGFESLWVPEHTHIPTSRRSPFAGGAELPEEYKHTLDPFVSLMAAAAATKNLRVGTGICLIIERDTITTAKTVASLDLLSNGRFELGIGGGWNAEEMENHGTVFKTRWKRLRESIEAMKTIWAEEEPEYHGELVKFDKIWSYPKPKQRPHPPIHLGGHGPKAIDRVVRYCDGWMPIAPLAGDMTAAATQLREAAGKAGRDPKTIELSAFWAPADAGILDEYRKAGVARAIFALPPAPRDEVLPLLDQYAKHLG